MGSVVVNRLRNFNRWPRHDYLASRRVQGQHQNLQPFCHAVRCPTIEETECHIRWVMVGAGDAVELCGSPYPVKPVSVAVSAAAAAVAVAVVAATAPAVAATVQVDPVVSAAQKGVPNAAGIPEAKPGTLASAMAAVAPSYGFESAAEWEAGSEAAAIRGNRAAERLSARGACPSPGSSTCQFRASDCVHSPLHMLVWCLV